MFSFLEHLGKDICHPQNVEQPTPTLDLYAEKQRHHSHPQEPSAFKNKNEHTELRKCKCLHRLKMISSVYYALWGVYDFFVLIHVRCHKM